MPQYLMSVHHAPEGPDLPPDRTEKMYADTAAFNEELRQAGNWVFAGGLEPPATATVVDGTGTQVLMTDGPWAESKEYLGGFWVVEAPDLDAALALAARGSRACQGKVEVRPFQA
jgi:hypothetical protein